MCQKKLAFQNDDAKYFHLMKYRISLRFKLKVGFVKLKLLENKPLLFQ